MPTQCLERFEVPVPKKFRILRLSAVDFVTTASTALYAMPLPKLQQELLLMNFFPPLRPHSLINQLKTVLLIQMSCCG